MKMYTLVVILGPTASGKTALSIRLAKKFGGVIISADSRQVYRGMNIGTGKITKKEMAGVPHYLLDVASPHGQYSVSRYVNDVLRALRRIKPSTPIFIVGGSAFYIKALTVPHSWSSVPPDPKLRRQLSKMTLAQLLKLLRKKNPAALKTIDRANRRRLERAIEIASTKNQFDQPQLPPLNVLTVGINFPRPVLNNRIDRRVDQRMRQGMIAEVQRLHQQGLSWKKLDAFGLEYRFISRYLRGHITKSEMNVQLKSAIHDFAKRQMTWWKHDTNIHWVTKKTDAQRLVTRFLP
jgi:tRNA dimethylallyltransferase